MNDRKPIFDAVKEARGGKAFTPMEVGALDNILDALGVPREGSHHAMTDPAAFFAAIRKITGPLNQAQVATINRLLETAAHWPTSWLAYGLATAWHESRFEPQPEWGRGKGKPYAKPGAYGQPQYGRGLVQLTWDRNYEWADEALGLDGKLLKDFDLALDPEIAADILVRGMEEGAFAGDAKGRHSLGRHLPNERGTPQQFTQARRIINGTDKALQIAGIAEEFQDAIQQGGWK